MVPRGGGPARRLARRHRGRCHDRAADGEAGRGRSTECRPRRRAVAERLDLRSGERKPLAVRPSSATDLEHGFSGLAKFFLPGKPALASLEAELFRRLGDRHVFDDQYLATGGQLHELITGRDRFVADLRPLVSDDGLACHPYDVCTSMLLTEAGGVVTDPWGRAAGGPARQRVSRWRGSGMRTRHWRRGSVRSSRSWSMVSRTGSAPGRLDLLGGVADYSGALVLEMPTRQSTEVVAEPGTGASWSVRPFSPVTETARLASLDYADVRRALAGLPRWTHYVLGVAVVLVRHGVISRRTRSSRISSDLPQSVGVASSAALEVATARALGRVPSTPSASLRCARRRRTTWWAPPAVSWTRWRSPQGSAAPCSRSCAGRRRRARPCPCRLIWRSSGGRPARRTTSAAHRTDGRGRQPSWGRGSWRSPRDGRGPGSANCRPQRWPVSPNSSTGADFVARWGDLGDAAHRRRPPRRRTRCAPPPPSASRSTPGARPAWRLSGRDDLSVWDTLLRASHAGYDAIGLGHPAATADRRGGTGHARRLRRTLERRWMRRHGGRPL